MSEIVTVIYTNEQDAIKRLLEKIRVGLGKHDRKQSQEPGGHSWASVGDLRHIRSQLQDVADCLNGEGEYSK